MPLTGERKRVWQRDYIRERRAAEKAGRSLKRQKPPLPTVRDELNALTARVAQLEADLVAARAKGCRDVHA
jgi:hypothetical protein